jgi:hypothetical protein
MFDKIVSGAKIFVITNNITQVTFFCLIFAAKLKILLQIIGVKEAVLG